MATATQTKAALEARIEQLEAQLSAITAECETLQQTLDAAAEQQSEARTSDLCQVLWINDRITTGSTRTGKRYIRFDAQYGRLDKRDGKRHYGVYKNFVAYGDEAFAVEAVLATGARLVRIEANELPWQDGSKRSDWIVNSMAAIARVNPESPQQQQLPVDPAVHGELPYNPPAPAEDPDDVLF